MVSSSNRAVRTASGSLSESTFWRRTNRRVNSLGQSRGSSMIPAGLCAVVPVDREGLQCRLRSMRAVSAAAHPRIGSLRMRGRTLAEGRQEQSITTPPSRYATRWRRDDVLPRLASPIINPRTDQKRHVQNRCIRNLIIVRMLTLRCASGDARTLALFPRKSY